MARLPATAVTAASAAPRLLSGAISSAPVSSAPGLRRCGQLTSAASTTYLHTLAQHERVHAHNGVSPSTVAVPHAAKLGLPLGVSCWFPGREWWRVSEDVCSAKSCGRLRYHITPSASDRHEREGIVPFSRLECDNGGGEHLGIQVSDTSTPASTGSLKLPLEQTPASCAALGFFVVSSPAAFSRNLLSSSLEGLRTFSETSSSLRGLVLLRPHQNSQPRPRSSS